MFLTVVLGASPSRAGYFLVTVAGDTLPAESVDMSGSAWTVKDGGSTVDVDVEATFRRNIEDPAEGEETNGFVWFKNGSFIQFESATLGEGLIAFDLGAKRKVKVPASLIDYRASVRETAAGRKPDVRNHDTIARSAEGGVATVAGGNKGSRGLGARGSVSPAARRQLSPTASPAFVSATAAARADLASLNSPPLDPTDVGKDIYSGTTLSQGSGPTSGTAASDAPGQTLDAGQQQGAGQQTGTPSSDVDRASEGHGMMSFTVSTDFPGEVGGVQLALGYPMSGVTLSRVTKLGDFLSGTAMNGPRCHGAAAPPNMSSSCFIVAMTPNPPVLGPTDIARYDFTWQDRRPAPSEFQLLQATGSDEGGTAIRSFRAQLRQN